MVNAVTHRDYSIKGTDIQIKMFDDRICVESPGKLPGTVKLDNIRTTHFSRNPKIAEFLRNYEYVKEYGEGVDRMYRELEDAGLAYPVFHMNAFMLQTAIFNSTALISKYDNQNLAVGGSIANFDSQNLAIGSSIANFDNQNLAIEEVADDLKIQKISIEVLKKRIDNKGYRQPMREKLLKIYSIMDANRVFSTTDVAKELLCPDSTARNIVKRLREMDVLIAVKGMGKNRYRFKYENEVVE